MVGAFAGNQHGLCHTTTVAGCRRLREVVKSGA
jgi:hypothetical protein